MRKPERDLRALIDYEALQNAMKEERIEKARQRRKLCQEMIAKAKALKAEIEALTYRGKP
jgi:hypothetical protein